MKVAIIGGGISGLSAALEMEKARAADSSHDYVLYEAGPRLGGSIFSERVEGCVVEGGPDSFLTEKPAAARLCRELGLGDQLISSNDAERKTYIVVRNRLVPMPDGLMFMVPTKLLPTATTRLFSWKTKLRMGLELLLPPRPMERDESVAEMVERHFGAEVVDRLADPLLSGIYGGDAAMLSARTVLPRLVEMEEKHGSLSRGMLAAHRRLKQAPQPANGGQRALFTTLKGGMQQMVDAIEQRLRAEKIRTSTAVQELARREDEWLVTSAGETRRFDAVVVATPAWAAARLLGGFDAELASDLAAIPYSSSITVTMAYSSEALGGLPEGFGFLVPGSEGRAMLACTFVHRKFPHRAVEGRGVLRCVLGGARNEALLETGDAAIEACVRTELRQITGVAAEPLFVRIYRNRRAMAQYTVGHRERAERIAAAVARQPSLALAGNAYLGIGVPDCIRTGQEAIASLLRQPSCSGSAAAACH